MIKRPGVTLIFLRKQKHLIQNLFASLSLGKCVTDLLVRLCTVPEIGVMNANDYHAMRTEIAQCAVNTLDVLGHDAMITSQVMDMLGSIVKRCYTMFDARYFFETLLSPFILMPLLEFTFEGGESTKQGCDFLRLMLHNLFLCEPQDAVIDVETDFGFEIIQVADIEVKQ